MTLNIGVLAIQGDVTENFLSVMASLSELGIDGTVSYTHLTLPTKA